MLKQLLKPYSQDIKETIHLAIPVTIGQIGQVLMGVIDDVMIGGVSYQHLSASSLANSVYFIIVVVGIGTTFAISPLVSEMVAQENKRAVGDYLRQGVWVASILGLLLALISYASVALLPYMGQPPGDVVLATSYMKILSISTLPMMVFLTFKQFSDGLLYTVPAMVVTLIGLVLNTFFNWVMIYGNLGCPILELDGAGYATLLSRTIMMLLLMVFVFKAKRYEAYDLLKRWMEWRPKTITKILQIGLPSGFQFFFEVGAFAGATIMIGWLGPEIRSAHRIALSLASLSFMVATSISAAGSIRVGDALGNQNMAKVRSAGMAAIILILVFELMTATGFVLCNEILPALYNVEEPIVLEYAARLLIIAAAFQIFDGVQTVVLGVLRGMQDVKIPTYISFTVYWLISLPLCYLFAFTWNWGVEGAWYSLVVSLILASVAYTWRFYKLSKQEV